MARLNIPALFMTVVLALAATVAQAQNSSQRDVVNSAVSAMQQEVQNKVKALAGQLDDLKDSFAKASTDDAKLSLLRLEADALGVDISGSTAQLEARYEVVTKRLEELGAPPAAGATEDASVANDRKRLQDEKAQMNSMLSDVDALKTEVGRVSADITNRRRDLFSETLFRRTVLSPDLLSEAGAAAVNLSGQVLSSTTNSLEFMWNFKRGSLLLAISLSLFIAVVFMIPLKRVLGPLAYRNPDEVDPPYFARVSLAFLSLIVPAAATAAFVLTCMIVLFSLNVLREDVFRVFASIVWSFVGLFFAWKLTWAIFAPRTPQWRLVNVSDRGARLIIMFAVILAAINGLSYIFTQTIAAFTAPVALSVIKGLISSLLIGITLIVMSFIRPLRDPLRPGASAPWSLWMRLLLLSLGIGLIVSAGFGYIGLAQFVASQVVVTSAIIITLYIGISSAHALLESGAFAKTRLGQRMAARYELDAMRLDQWGLVASLLSYAAVIFIGVPLILLQWGFRIADVIGLFIRLFTEIHIGNITISLLGIAAGIGVFFAGLFGSRWLQRWLDDKVLARSQIDGGARNSLNTAIGYAGVVIAGVIGISAAGINLSSLALIASALSLGIGFGLQTIVQNFVSGLILLAERPFRVGDWVVNGEVEGFVRRSAVRTTEIETFRNQSVIVPNSQLINASVGNWTLRNKLARSEIPVSVAYGSDPRKVIDLLLEIARAQPLVLTMPEPHVELVRFGEYSLDFELRFYLADLFTGLGVRNELRIQILERFEEEGIEIPYPHRVLMLRKPDDAALMMQALRGEGMSDDEAKALAAARDTRRRQAESGARDIDSVQASRNSNDHDGPPMRPKDDEDEDGDDGDGDGDDGGDDNGR